MRSIICAASLAVLISALGCNLMHRGDNPPPPPPSPTPREEPTVPALVNYLNNNAARIPPGHALNSINVTIDASAEAGQVGVSARMLCQGPRNFLLSGLALGTPVVDVGSNDREFWFWCKQLVDRAGNPPYLYHCSYQALASGNVKVPFPFQPDMALNALGLTPYDPAKKYDLEFLKDKKGNRAFIDLKERALSPENKPILKVTRFNYNRVTDVSQPQVVAHIIKDEQGKTICAATIRYAQRVGGENGPVIPQMIEFKWPEQKMSMTMTINQPRFVAMPPEKAAMVFSRQNLRYQSFDLATQALDGAGVQRASATGMIIRR